MFKVALIVVGCAMSALLTFAVFYMREIKATYQRVQDDQARKIEKIEGRLDEMPEKYVYRDDFIRWTIGVDKKIDDLAKDVKSLLKREGKGVEHREQGD